MAKDKIIDETYFTFINKENILEKKGTLKELEKAVAAEDDRALQRARRQHRPLQNPLRYDPYPHVPTLYHAAPFMCERL